MHICFHLFGLQIPAYGTMIALGLVLANAAAVIMARRRGEDLNDFILTEAWCVLCGFAGAKALYLIVSARQIDWSAVRGVAGVNALMSGGFVFYGGLIGGLIGWFLAAKIHKIDAVGIVKRAAFMVPLIHGFGRIGCFCAGCCYGVPYEGPGAVVFPEGPYTLPGVPLFPVQLTEAAVLFVLAALLLGLQLRTDRRAAADGTAPRAWTYPVELYFLVYGAARFVLEFLRYDDVRGHIGALSTSQVISLAAVAAGIVLIILKKNGLIAGPAARALPAEEGDL